VGELGGQRPQARPGGKARSGHRWLRAGRTFGGTYRHGPWIGDGRPGT
jgi:hypothetical protein